MDYRFFEELADAEAQQYLATFVEEERDRMPPRRRLTAAGFEQQLAGELADQPEIDLHELLTLLDRGCPPELAARILAPLDADLS